MSRREEGEKKGLPTALEDALKTRWTCGAISASFFSSLSPFSASHCFCFFAHTNSSRMGPPPNGRERERERARHAGPTAENPKKAPCYTHRHFMCKHSLLVRVYDHDSSWRTTYLQNERPETLLQGGTPKNRSLKCNDIVVFNASLFKTVPPPTTTTTITTTTISLASSINLFLITASLIPSFTIRYCI